MVQPIPRPMPPSQTAAKPLRSANPLRMACCAARMPSSSMADAQSRVGRPISMPKTYAGRAGMMLVLKVWFRRRWKISWPCRASNPRRVGLHEMVMGSRGVGTLPRLAGAAGNPKGQARPMVDGVWGEAKSPRWRGKAQCLSHANGWGLQRGRAAAPLPRWSCITGHILQSEQGKV